MSARISPEGLAMIHADVTSPGYLAGYELALLDHISVLESELRGAQAGEREWPHGHAEDPRLNSDGTPLAGGEAFDFVHNMFVRCHACNGAAGAGADCDCGGTGFDWSDTADARATLAALDGLVAQMEALREALREVCVITSSPAGDVLGALVGCSKVARAALAQDSIGGPAADQTTEEGPRSPTPSEASIAQSPGMGAGTSDSNPAPTSGLLLTAEQAEQVREAVGALRSALMCHEPLTERLDIAVFAALALLAPATGPTP